MLWYSQGTDIVEEFVISVVPTFCHNPHIVTRAFRLVYIYRRSKNKQPPRAMEPQVVRTVKTPQAGLVGRTDGWPREPCCGLEL